MPRLLSNANWKLSQLFLVAVIPALLAIPLLQGSAGADGKPRQKRRSNDPCKVERDQIKVEEELRVALRTLRQAIDAYHEACDKYGRIGPLNRTVDDMCYPQTLQVLVDGVAPPNTKIRLRYLRRIPIDPITGKREWGLRSIQDEPDSFTWGGQNVFDVYSKSDRVGTDGLKYWDW